MSDQKRLSDKAVTSAVGLYRALVQHKIYENRLQWSMVQTLYAIQAGVLAGAFALKYAGWAVPDYFGGLLLILGGSLTLALLAIVLRANKDQAVNDDIIDQLKYDLLKESNIQEDGEFRRTEERRIRWTAERFCLRSNKIFCLIMVVFAIIDFTLGGYFLT